jgi:hypothetical protein
MNKIMRIVIYMNDMYELATTERMTCIDFRALKSLNILSTLKVLKTLSTLRLLPILTPRLVDNNSKTLVNTINPSSQFIVSERYLDRPIAIYLTTISYMNMYVKYMLASSRKFLSSSGMP